MTLGRMIYLSNAIVNDDQMRKIIDSVVTRQGDLRAIYSVGGSKFKTRDAEVGGIYEVTYRLGNKEAYLKGKLVGWTENHRTLFFKVDDKEIGVPIFNIYNYVRK